MSRFVLGVDDQPVRLVDDLLLSDRAQRGSGASPSARAAFFTAAERVRGVHQRHRPAVAGQPADLTGQPVVRVHDVVVAGFVRRLGAQHPGRERAQLRRQVVLVQALEGPGHHVAHQHAGATRATGGSADAVARVKISTSMPRRARCSAVCST